MFACHALALSPSLLSDRCHRRDPSERVHGVWTWLADGARRRCPPLRDRRWERPWWRGYAAVALRQGRCAQGLGDSESPGRCALGGRRAAARWRRAEVSGRARRRRTAGARCPRARREDRARRLLLGPLERRGAAAGRFSTSVGFLEGAPVTGAVRRAHRDLRFVPVGSADANKRRSENARVRDRHAESPRGARNRHPDLQRVGRGLAGIGSDRRQLFFASPGFRGCWAAPTNRAMAA